MTNIVTLTLNPAIDVSTSAGHVAANRKLRCEAPRYEPGGGGINVSVAMAELGGKSTAVFPCGGPPGEIVRHLLVERGIDHRPVEIKGWTRWNLATRDQSSDDQYRFLMPGPQISSDEVRSCLDLLGSIEPEPDYIVVSGSFPPGVPAEVMHDLVSAAREHKARLVVDSSGKALRIAAREGVFLLKPNMRELCHLTDEDTSTEAGQEKAMRRLVEQSGCDVAILSLGAAGVLMATADRLERLRAPTVPIASRVGAGDSMVAGILVGLCRNYDILDAVRHGIAAGSAAVMTPGTELCRREDVERLFRELSQGTPEGGYHE
jgi:6-phosphofructokinase 2